ncbi:hypothetical protein BDY21DRAFT_420886 [Lineolata rhizophorae]|uniref:Fibroin-3 related protein n=1 Tax=Lineolata rhizophorae TaxID=578093 RepID=A0A6A6P3A6_9PEZI|nr:hypothetical protein BDY21DRAFT_420886 [Lineolata rhizophorae]
MPILYHRQDIIDDLNGAKDTFSSWDKCMAESYCKYPVIVAIVVGSLIAISVLICCMRCLCFGKECCCGCLSCCNACCPSPRRRGHKELSNSAPPPMPYGGNQPAYGGAGPTAQQYRAPLQPSYAQPQPDRPQFATFDVSSGKGGNYNEDALPAMPTWEQAKSTKVEETVAPQQTEEVELNKLDKDGREVGAEGVGAAIALPNSGDEASIRPGALPRTNTGFQSLDRTNSPYRGSPTPGVQRTNTGYASIGRSNSPYNGSQASQQGRPGMQRSNTGYSSAYGSTYSAGEQAPFIGGAMGRPDRYPPNNGVAPYHDQHQYGQDGGQYPQDNPAYGQDDNRYGQGNTQYGRADPQYGHDDPYRQDNAQFRQDSYGQAPYGQAHAQAPYGQASYGQTTGQAFGQPRYARDNMSPMHSPPPAVTPLPQLSSPPPALQAGYSAYRPAEQPVYAPRSYTPANEQPAAVFEAPGDNTFVPQQQQGAGYSSAPSGRKPVPGSQPYF